MVSSVSRGVWWCVGQCLSFDGARLLTSQLCILLLQSLCWDSPSSWACWRYVPAPAPTAAWSVGAANKTRLNRVASRTRTRLPRRWRVQSIRCACFAVHTSIRRCCVIVRTLCARLCSDPDWVCHSQRPCRSHLVSVLRSCPTRLLSFLVVRSS